eukprot:797692_1
MEQIRKQHEMQKTNYLWIFFDEINTSPDIGYFKEIVCDQYFDGEALPSNMKVIAACNPYRKRNVDHLSEKSILNDPLAKFVYRVYPLPSTMKEYVWMFGSLSANDEAAYASQMCQTFTSRILHSDSDKKRLSNCIVAAQGFVRKTLRDSAMVSLRDMARCLKLFVWIYEREKKFNKAMIMCIALVYYFRLDEAQRKSFSDKISQNVKKFQKTLIGKNAIIDTFCAKFKGSIPKGIALNRALKENLFLLFLCIQTKTPLILIGKPGSSKTLAMSVIREYLSDHNRRDLKQDKLLPIHVVSFQCSAQSRAEGIQQRWAQTQKFAEDNKRDDTIYVLLLDEIGLAEHSAYRPLKVLHQLLEIDPPPISFIGLSNWKLDASKMNRAICHLCPIHKIHDLNATGRAMAKAYAQHDIDKLHPMISLLSNVYSDVMRYENCIQPRYDFFGARDFYSVVRHFLTAKNKETKVYDQNEELIMYFLRNFGGINYERIHGNMSNQKGTSLYHLLCKHMALNTEYIAHTISKYSPHKLIELNLTDKRSTHEMTDSSTSDNFMISRHIMAITEYYNSWNILLDLNIINYDNIFIFGSEFERDKANIYLYLNKVKNCMETGKTLLLINLEEIHESLYDMLNQRYTFVKTSNKMYCRIALGSNSQTCFVDPAFKCIVISTKFDAHRKGGVPIAFLNRFEKQLISYYSSLSSIHEALLKDLQQAIYNTYSLRNMEDIQDIFPGFCKDTLSSLILNKVPLQNVANANKLKNYDIVNDDEEDIWMEEHKYNAANADIDRKDIINKCMQTLSGVTLPEALIQSAISKKKGGKSLSYLPTLQSIMETPRIHPLLIILTYDFATKLETNSEFLHDTTMIKRMSDFSKSEDFEMFIHKYLSSKQDKSLLLQYKHKYNGMNHFMHIKHIIETALYKQYKPRHKKQITILVHLRRLSTRNIKKKKSKRNVSFPLILSESSKTVFLDSLSQTKPIELNEFANQTIQEICKQQGIDLLKSIFQRSLSHLVFPQKINVEDEIKKLSAILDDTKDNPLQQCILHRFIKLLSDNKINRNIAELVSNVAVTSSQWSRGSFYERLYDVIDTICVVAMMRVLQSLYENDNIDTIYNSKNEEISKLFIELYSNFDLIELDSIDVNIESIVENRPDKLYIKYDYSAQFPFSQTIHDWSNSQKTKLNINPARAMERMQAADIVIPGTNVINIAQHLKREMNSSMPSILGDLSINMVELYASDMIFLNAHKLQIDKTWSKPLLALIVKYMIVSTMFFCRIRLHEDDDHKDLRISIAELESTLLHKHEFIRHLIKVSSIFPVDYVSKLSDSIEYTTTTQSYALIHVVDLILNELIHASDVTLSQSYQVNSLRSSITYMIQTMDECNDEEQKCDKEMNGLYIKSNVCHVAHIAVKNKLKPMSKDNIAALSEIFGRHESSISLCHYDTFHDVLHLLMGLIAAKEKDKESVCNQLLLGLLTSIDNADLNKCSDLLQYAQFLINLLCKNEKIIGKHAQHVKWNKDTEYEITKQLFLVMSHDSIKASKLINEIQGDNSPLAAMIIQSMHSSKKSKKVKSTKYVESDEAFNPKLSIRAPLVRQFNPEIYDEAHKLITIANFFEFAVGGNHMMYPVLSKLKSMNTRRGSFWKMHRIPDIAQWMKLIHSKYMGTLSEQGCREFVMNDVFKQCKLHKWGDQNEWKAMFTEYRDHLNHISDNPQIQISSSDVKAAISSSLIANKCGNKQIQNNLKSIQTMIRINNYFASTISMDIRDIAFFDVRKEDLMNTQIVLDIIKSHSKLWICYDPRDRLPPETYIIFDLERIEHQIQNKCIFGRKRLRIKYQNFQFVGSKNMLRLIQSIGIEHEILNYELWHLFDQKFESNMQRKKALTTIEDVLMLISNVKLVETDNDDLDVFEDEKDDQKYQNNNDHNHHDVAVNSQNQEFWRFMQNTLKYDAAKCNIFKVAHRNKTIQLKHIQSLWNELVKRIDGERTQYQEQCYVCFYPILDNPALQEATPIQLECCELNLHFECLKEWIQRGFGKKGTRITLTQLSCLMCKQPMRHKAANELFQETRVLYDKVQRVALEQLRTENKLNDPAVTSKDGEYYNDPTAYAMKLYAIWLCYDCGKPYYYGPNACGNEAHNVREDQFVCMACYDARMEKLRRENAQQYAQWAANNGIKPCPGGCGHGLQKISGCNWIKCACGTEVCWQTGLRAGRGAGMCGGGHACHF